MSHKRAQLRQAAVDILEAIEDLGATVHRTRIRPTPDEKLPAVNVYALRETSELQNMKRNLGREASLVLEIRVGTTEDMDDEIDDLCEKVENAMESSYLFGGLATNSWLASTTIGIDGEGDYRQGVASMEYRVGYRTVPGAVSS